MSRARPSSLSRTCPACGHAITKRVVYQGLVIEDNPPAAIWRGKGLSLTPSMITILGVLARTGRAMPDALADKFSAADDPVKTVQVHISYMRRRLRGQGVPIQIVSNKSRGYELVMPTPSNARHAGEQFSAA